MSLLKHLFLLILLCHLSTSMLSKDAAMSKRALERSHEKPQAEKWMDAFYGKNLMFDQVPSLVNLIIMISRKYLSGCTSVILYDMAVENSDGLLLQKLFQVFPSAFIHGQISSDYKVSKKELLRSSEIKCVNYILFMEDVMKCKDVIGSQNENQVVIIAKSSQWRVYEFLASDVSQSFINLLVVAQSEKLTGIQEEMPYILYTHNLYVDGLGSSTPQVLTSWVKNSLTRPQVNLFPEKMKKGFAGHRFIFALANQPPYVIRRGRDDNDDLKWEGIEIRLSKLLAELYNFTTDFREAKDTDVLGSGDAVMQELRNRKADIGMSGIYIVPERVKNVDITYGHSQDCAAFISLASIALSKWRAIMGPFQWTVWLSLTIVYLLAIFPLAFSDRHSLRYLIESPEEIENMFWYVFGTFTNCFTFVGTKSWGKTDKVTTRLLIGFYWIFTIILTACYTGSIIAFVTLPVLPDTVDTVKQLLSGRYQIGMLDKGGWPHWFKNSSDPMTTRLFKNVELVSSTESGIKNITTAFFWSYAYLGSRDELDYVVRKNFTAINKRSLLHISSECFVPYRVGMIFAKNSVYKAILNKGTMRAVESGFMIKFKSDVEFEMMRSSTGRLLQASGLSMRDALSAEDRALALQDTQGMFLLLSTGFALGALSLISEWFGGCLNLCKKKMLKSRATSIVSNPRSYDVPTPRQKLDSIQYSQTGNIFESLAEDQDDNENRCSESSTRASSNTSQHLEDTEVVLENHVGKEIDYDSEINEIFNFEELFGEENEEEEEGYTKDELLLGEKLKNECV